MYTINRMPQGLDYSNVQNVKGSFEYKEYRPLVFGISAAVYDKIRDEDIKRSLAKLTVDNEMGNVSQAYDKLMKFAEKVRKANAKFYMNKNHLDKIIHFIQSSYQSNQLLYEKLFVLLSLVINHISDLNTDAYYSTHFIRPDTIYLSKNASYDNMTFMEMVEGAFIFLEWANTSPAKRSAEPPNTAEYENLLEYYKDSTTKIMASMGIKENNSYMFIKPEKTKMDAFKSMFGIAPRHDTSSIQVKGGSRRRTWVRKSRRLRRTWARKSRKQRKWLQYAK